MTKVVAVVGISHDDVLTGSGGDASHQRTAISFGRHMNYLGSKPLGDLDRFIRAPVVGNNNFAGDIRIL